MTDDQLVTDVRRMARAIVRNTPGIGPDVIERMKDDRKWDVLVGDDDVLAVVIWPDELVATIPAEMAAAAVGLLRARRDARRRRLD